LRIRSTDISLTIDFETLWADWSLLVIDDKWDTVKEMTCGEEYPISGSYQPGLGQACIDADAVDAYWNRRYPSEETFERALLFLPSMVLGTEGFAGVTFCGFPGSVDRLRTIMAEAIESKDSQGATHWAVLIDIRDESQHRQRFVETWEVLDQLPHQSFARAKFTRGGAALPSWTEDVELIPKEPPTGGLNAHKLRIQDWLGRVRGVISPDIFHSLTQGTCHNPADLAIAAPEERKRICSALATNDLYGVWRWCAIEASQEFLPATALNKWLAAKTFQTSSISGEQVPLTAVIAICEGARMLLSGPARWNYTVDSPLLDIPESDINKFKALGSLVLHRGTYGGFAAALRDWLVNPEQFCPDNSVLRRISILSAHEAQSVQIRLEYSSDLPPSIFNPTAGGRRGRTGRTWDSLVAFAKGHTESENVLALEFSWAQ
jgi:hypothetical protein